jgi:phage terminase large subunit GpA-like protein
MPKIKRKPARKARRKAPPAHRKTAIPPRRKQVTKKSTPAESLPAWIERTIRHPAGSAAKPGPMKLYTYQRGIAAATGDAAVERLTVLKSARIGYTAVMTHGIANLVAGRSRPRCRATCMVI